MHNVTQFEVGSNYLLPDHYPILWSYKIAPSTDRDAKQTGEKPLRWSKEKKVAATLAIDGCMPRLSEILESSESLSTITEQFTNTLYEAVRPVLQLGAKQLTGARPGAVGEEPSDGDDITPHTRTSHPKQPWFCETCGVLRDAALAHLNKLRPNHEHELNKQRLESAKKKYNDHKKQCKLNYRISQTKHVLSLRVDNARAYWRLLNTGRAHSNPDIDMADFVAFFREVNSPSDLSMFQTRAEVLNFLENTRDEVGTPRYEELDVEVSEEELKKAISGLKNCKAAGPDHLIYEVFKYIDSLHPLVLKLYNMILSTGHFPIQWTQGVIVPLHKKGPKDLASNYRGITLLDTLSKLFTKVLNTWVSSWAEANGIYAESQCGFRDNHSTADGVYLLHSVVDKCTNRHNGRIYAGRIDFQKAFDYVVHNNVWAKMIANGVTGRILKVIQSMYRQLKNQVRDFQGNLSDPFEGVIGLRQGESLSPLLFALIMNDIESELRRGQGDCSL